MNISDLKNKTVWVLEDDLDCQFIYKDILDFRYKTVYFSCLADFSNALTDQNNVPDLIIADLLLGDDNFLNFLNESQDSRLLNRPFIVVSSVDDIDALRLCFKEGALDYLTKPFKKNEILVKVENILSKKNEGKVDLTSSYAVDYDGHQIQNLTLKQKELLDLFVQSPELIVSREEILEKAWTATNVHPKTIDVHIYNLRRKLHSHGLMIKSEGKGRWRLMSTLIS